jgi:hypothetical protein
MKEKKSYSILDFKEADPLLEQHRKDVIEKFMEYEVVLLNEYKAQGKSLDDYLEHMKTTLWYVKDQRAHQINDELGL